jgi:hypothetical protein
VRVYRPRNVCAREGHATEAHSCEVGSCWLLELQLRGSVGADVGLVGVGRRAGDLMERRKRLDARPMA